MAFLAVLALVETLASAENEHAAVALSGVPISVVWLGVASKIMMAVEVSTHARKLPCPAWPSASKTRSRFSIASRIIRPAAVATTACSMPTASSSRRIARAVWPSSPSMVLAISTSSRPRSGAASKRRISAGGAPGPPSASRVAWPTSSSQTLLPFSMRRRRLIPARERRRSSVSRYVAVKIREPFAEAPVAKAV